jgi:predicted AAA+ superfamily ATPase
MTEPLERFLGRVDSLIDRLEKLVPAGTQAIDWSAGTAFRWRKRGGRGVLDPVRHPHAIAFADLKDIDEQKKRVRENTAQFVAGRPANNVLLTGARGTGKSSLIKAALNEFSRKGLRLIEVDKADLVDLPDIVDLVADRRERFIVFCDDLSFEASDPGYKSLKVALDGTIAGSSENLLIYATSNRRHLMPEFMDENLEARHVGGEIHPGETTEEKISLSERFGVWLSFYPFDQDQYLDIAAHWVESLGGKANGGMKPAALLWALERGSRSGRVAWQFAKDYVGRGAGVRGRK